MTDRLFQCGLALTPDGWVADFAFGVSNEGFIQQADTASDGPVIRLPGAVIPGMPNVHSHAFQRAMVGLAGHAGSGDDSFWTWRQAMYDLANRVTPGQLQAIAAWLQAEMLKGGYTSCAEFHYLHHQPNGRAYDNPAEMSARILSAADESGLPVTLLPVLYCRAGFGQHEVSKEQRRFTHTPDSFMKLFEACEALPGVNRLHRLGAAPHSLRAVSGAQLQALLDALGDRAAPLHLHLAEQPAEVSDCERHLGSRPARYLLDHFAVDSRWCLVHATHLDDREVEDAARSGAVAGLCPTTEADLGDGLFRLADWLRADGALAVGSDSNVRVSAFEELRWLEYGGRLATGRRNVMARKDQACGRAAWQKAAQNGANALAQPAGQLAPGCRADLVELDRDHPLLVGLSGDELLQAAVFGAGRSCVRSAWVGGDCLVENGEHRNEAELHRRFVQALEELRT